MIVCHCNRICHRAIESACDDIAACGGDGCPSPDDVYAALGVVPNCRGCFRLASRVIEAVHAARRAEMQGLTPDCTREAGLP